MKQESITERLSGFGLTRQESTIYYCLLSEGKLTGYEAAKLTGISRSNAYGALASLTDKGAAYSEEDGKVKKHTPVPLTEFCENHIGKMQRNKQWLEDHVTSKKPEEEGYITIEGDTHILNKIRNLLKQVDERVYISASRLQIRDIEEDIHRLSGANKKVVIITDVPFDLAGVNMYKGDMRPNQIGIIGDSKYVLTGEYGSKENSTCLYSGQRNFVELFKNALSNEIKIIKYQKGEM